METLVIMCKMILEATVRLPDTADAWAKWRGLKPQLGPFEYFNFFADGDIQIIIWPNFTILNNAPGGKSRIIAIADGS